MTQPGFSLLSALSCAVHGIADASHERNFRIELCFLVCCVILGLVFAITPGEWVACIICFGLVLGGECVNTSIEAVIDLASPEYAELARTAKDAAAGGVLLFSLASFAVGVVVFVPRILAILGLI